MIIILILIAAVFSALIWVIGAAIAGLAIHRSNKWQKHWETHTPPDLMEHGRPIGADDLQGWDGEDILEIDEELE